MNNEIMKLIIDENIVLTKGYQNPKNINQWNLGRCRIDANFFVEAILDYFFNNLSANKLTEKYLIKTRNINKMEKKFQPSNSQDFSAIKIWFKLNNFSEELRKELEKHKISDIEQTIVEYIDTIIKQQSYLVNKDLSEQWRVYFASKSSYSHIDVEEKITEYMKDKNNELKLLEPRYLYEGTMSVSSKQINSINFEVNNENKELIGASGKQLVFNYLIDKYGIDNVTWSSKNNKYENHDFELKIGNIIKYIEVKTTTENEMRRFYLSRKEYHFYKENKKNYDLYLVANIKYWSKDNIYTPTLIIKESPVIKIDLDKSGIKDGEILITPYNFIANW